MKGIRIDISIKNIIICSVLFMAFCYILTGKEILAFNAGEKGKWECIEIESRTELWQKKDEYIMAENLIYLTSALSTEVIKGYSINEGELDIWKVIYNGFDSSGNIYFKIYKIKEDLTAGEEKKIKNLIERYIDIKEDNPDLISLKEEYFDYLKSFLSKDGEGITVDSGKIIIIKGIDFIPPFEIQTSPTNSIINIKIVKIE